MNIIICHNQFELLKHGVVFVSHKQKLFIDFDTCAKRFSLKNEKNISRCVANRDISTLSFTFFTQPEIKVIFKRRFPKDLFSGKSATKSFLELQKAIIEAGYTSYDLT